MGCLARIGCLALIIIAVVVGWITKDRWWPGDREERASAPVWEPLTPQGAQRTQTALRRLQQPQGPAFASLTGGDVASYIFLGDGQQIAGFTDSAEAAVIDEQLVVRATVSLRDIGALRDLGPFAGLLNDRERVQIAARLNVLEPGRGEMTVTDLRVRDIKLPSGLLRRIVVQRRDSLPPAQENSLPVRLPRHIADVRVADGRITLYKNTP